LDEVGYALCSVWREMNGHVGCIDVPAKNALKGAEGGISFLDLRGRYQGTPWGTGRVLEDGV
jgi:hypothetical protein